MKNFIITIVILFLSATCVLSFDFINDKELGLGKTVLLSRSSASMLLAVPSGSLSEGTLLMEAGMNRKFEIRDLDQGYLAGAYRYKEYTFTIGMTQFGYRDFYAERIGKVGVAYSYDSITIGASFSYMTIDFGSYYESLSGSSFSLGGTYRGSKYFIAMTIDDLNSPGLDDKSEKIKPKYNLYSEIIGLGSYSITGKITLQKYEKPQLGIGQKVELSELGSIFWGLSTAPVMYGGGLEISYKKTTINYATSYHPTLGFSHTISMGYRWSNKNVKGDVGD